MFTVSRARHPGYITTSEKDIKINGLWYLPENKEDEVSGTLTIYHNGGIVLDLTGFFSDSDSEEISVSHEMNKLREYDVIRGTARTGGNITLHNCKDYIRRTPFGSGTLHAYISCETAYFDRAYDNESEIKFNRFDLRLPYLREWLWLFGFNADIDDQDNWKLSFDRPEEYISQLDENNISIRTFASYHEEGHKRIAEQISYFKFILKEKRSFDEFKKEFLIPTQNFVSFVTDTPNWIEYIAVKSENENQDETLTKIHHLFPFKRGAKEKNTHPRDCLFWLKKIELTFDEIFTKWMEIHTELNTVLDLYLGVLFNRNFFPKTRFTNLMQACETYHSIRFASNLIDEKEHSNRVREVVSKIPEEHKEWANLNLYHSNYKSLKDRLLELFQPVSFIYEPYISSFDILTSKLKDTRNYYTHYNEQLKEKAANDEELILLTELISTLLKVHILKELGFPDSHLEKLNQDHQQFKTLNDVFPKRDYEYAAG